jgi:cytolysin (calcineurin-like family phosphatase)
MFEANHDEVPVFKPKACIAGGFKTEQSVVPMMNTGHGFGD